MSICKKSIQNKVSVLKKENWRYFLLLFANPNTFKGYSLNISYACKNIEDHDISMKYEKLFGFSDIIAETKSPQNVTKLFMCRGKSNISIIFII